MHWPLIIGALIAQRLDLGTAGIALVQSDVRGDPADWAGYAFSRSALVAPEALRTHDAIDGKPFSGAVPFGSAKTICQNQKLILLPGLCTGPPKGRCMSLLAQLDQKSLLTVA